MVVESRSWEEVDPAAGTEVAAAAAVVVVGVVVGIVELGVVGEACFGFGIAAVDGGRVEEDSDGRDQQGEGGHSGGVRVEGAAGKDSVEEVVHLYHTPRDYCYDYDYDQTHCHCHCHHISPHQISHSHSPPNYPTHQRHSSVLP